MRLAMFTEVFGAAAPEAVAAWVARLGIDGVDLLVREGSMVSPQRPDAVVAAARAFERVGLRLEVVSTDLVEPGEPAWALLAASAWAGVRLVRLGSYGYEPALGYTTCRERARRCLAGLAEYAREAGVTLALQLRPGTVHASGALAASLLDGLEPAIVGACADPGAQVGEGSEDWRLTLDLLGARLRCVDVRNAGWFRQEGSWSCQWVGLADGIVPWSQVLAHLAASSYAGVLSVHAGAEGALESDVAFLHSEARKRRRTAQASA